MLAKKILLIEDNLEMAENVINILRLVNYKIEHAPNGITGLALAKQAQPDLIICDVVMPDLDGFGVLHILSKDSGLCHTPFIFLTGRTETNDRRSGMNLGADDYITKPFEGLDLLKVVEVRLNKADQLKSNGHVSPTANNSDVPNGEMDFEKLLIHQHARTFRKKDIIFLEGQAAFDMYYVMKGEIKTYKVNHEGKELITGFHNPGSYLGYIPLIEEKPHHESAEALEDSEIAIIPKQDFLELINSSRTFGQKFIRLLSQNIIATGNRLLDIAYQSVRQRVAGALLKANQISHHGSEKDFIIMTRKDISNVIGTTTESLNRTLADFRDEGLIEVTDHGLRILNQPKLIRISK